MLLHGNQVSGKILSLLSIEQISLTLDLLSSIVQNLQEEMHRLQNLPPILLYFSLDQSELVLALQLQMRMSLVTHSLKQEQMQPVIL